MTTERRGVRLVAAVVLAAVALGACSDDSGTDGTGPLVSFGEGAIPDQVPEDFPIPPGAVIGSTLVDGRNTRTEFEMRVRQEMADIAQFFTVNLVSSGFVIDDSSEDGTRWTLEFRRDALRGTILITSPTAGVSQAVVSFNVA